MTENKIITIPAPLEILSGKEKEFISRVFRREPMILEQITVKNYRSYIAAIAFITKQQYSQFKRTSEESKKLAKDLKQIFSDKNIVLHHTCSALLNDCSAGLVGRTVSLFSHDYYDFLHRLQDEKL